MRVYRGIIIFVMAVAIGTLSGCHSAIVATTISNQSGGALQMIELDYPSASFGVNSLPNGAEYTYRIEVHGSSALHISYLDAAGGQHQADGPVLRDGDQGALLIIVGPQAQVSWQR
jgi:hypothetical protein